MGKGGRGRANKPPAETLSEDALLEQAIALAKSERAEAAQQKQQPAAGQKKLGANSKAAPKKTPPTEPSGGVLTMPEVLAKLDKVMTFTISRVLSDGAKDACPSPSGAVTFYVDSEDAKADLEALKAADSTLRLSLDFCALGRAFALTQGLMGLRAPGPTRLQFSRKLVAAVGDQGVPENLRERMRSAGPFPLFFCEELGAEQFTPVFFSVPDMHELWLTCGGDPARRPEATVTDLRVIVARTMQERGNWEPLNFVPPRASEALTKELGARAEREEALKSGFSRGTETLKKVAHAVAVEEGDEPPELT